MGKADIHTPILPSMFIWVYIAGCFNLAEGQIFAPQGVVLPSGYIPFQYGQFSSQTGQPPLPSTPQLPSQYQPFGQFGAGQPAQLLPPSPPQQPGSNLPFGQFGAGQTSQYLPPYPTQQQSQFLPAGQFGAGQASQPFPPFPPQQPSPNLPFDQFAPRQPAQLLPPSPPQQPGPNLPFSQFGAGQTSQFFPSLPAQQPGQFFPSGQFGSGQTGQQNAQLRPGSPLPTPGIQLQSLDQAQPVIATQAPRERQQSLTKNLLWMLLFSGSGQTTPEPAVTSAPFTVPATFATWAEYGNCRYKSFTDILSYNFAKDACVKLGATLATVNVKESTPLRDIFAKTFLLTSEVWVGLEDPDGSTTTIDPRWIDNALFVAETTTNYADGGAKSCAFVNANSEFTFTFTRCNSAGKVRLCEYCPTLT